MGRQPKKMPGENGADKLLSEKIMGKFPKVKCNKENLDFDEDDIDGINILSFTTFEQLKEYYPLDKITPHGQKEEVKKTNPKRRRTNKNNSEKAPRKVKLGKTKNAKIQVANCGLSQFDKSDSEGEHNLLVKTEESPPPSPLPDIPMSVEESANSNETKMEARPGSSTSEQTTAFKHRSPSHFSLTNTGTVVSSCTSGSPVYQPAADLRIRTQSTASSSSRPPSLPLSARLPTPPNMPAGTAPYGTPPYGHFPLQRHPVAGMPHVQLDKHSMHFPGNPEHQARLRAELNNHFLSTMGGMPRRPFFAGHPALGAHPRPGLPEGALIKKKMEKKWNTCHVRIAHLIYKIQQQQAVELKAKQVHEAQAAQMNGAAAAAAAHNGRSFSSISSTTRDPLRDFPNFAGAHSLPPTPNTTPFSHPSSPFQSTAGVNSFPGHHSIGGLRMPGMHYAPRMSAPHQLPPQFHPGAFGPQFWLPPDLSKEHDGHRPPFPHIAGHHPANEKEMAEAHAAATFKHPELAYGSAASMNELRERFAMDALRHREQQHRESLLQAHLGQHELHPQLQMEELHKRFQNHSEAHKMNPAMALYMQQQQQQQHLNNIHAAAVLKYPHITPHQLFNFTRFDSGPSRYSSMLASQPKGPE